MAYLSLHYNGDNSYLFVNGKQICKFKAKNSELIKYQMCLGGLSYDYTTNDNNKKTDYMEMFMILVLIIVPLKLIKYKIFTIN